jgi:hypothetical protein
VAFRRIATLHAWIICLTGILFTGWGPMLLPLYGFHAAPEFFPSAGSFVRLAVSVDCLRSAAGRRPEDRRSATQRHRAVIIESHLVAIAVTAQQIAIGHSFGWATVAVFCSSRRHCARYTR